MNRSQRLLQLLQLLREHHFPVTAETLAHRLDVSVRTIYRDIETLKHQGANIAGDGGLGFQVQTGFFLPPMMWTENEIEALILGTRWVAHLPDDPLKQAATSILAKLQAILPEPQQRLFEQTTLYAINQWLPVNQDIVACIRLATRQQKKLHIGYENEAGQQGERMVWPFTIGYFNDKMILAAWCELRHDFRHFRLDRVRACKVIDEYYPSYKKQLFKQWCISQRITITADRN